MRIIFHRRSYVVFIILALVLVGLFLVKGLSKNDDSNLVTTTVERGDVNETVSVSGFIEAKNTANLSFPVTGKVTKVFIEEGEEVEEGEILATLATSKLVADRAEALATLQSAQASLNETLSGATSEERDVAQTTLNNAKSDLAQIISEQAEKVENARVALLSIDLEATSNEPREKATAPTVSGTYNCDTEGIYTLNVYRSKAASGYSYQLTGLESETASAFVNQPSPLANCGLFIQFDANSQYDGSEWTIEIPNTRSSSYVTYKNAYDLAVEQQKNAIANASDNLNLAKEQAKEVNASARSEIVSQKTAVVDQAKARVSQIDALLSDYSIVAPFKGIITNVGVIDGEIAGVAPVITLLAEDAFELTARIPEIDIRKIRTGQLVKVNFDAATEEEQIGHISYVSPLATEIDGVAYFEATIVLEENPDWLRSGLNADIEIFVDKKTDTLRLPTRFIINEAGRNFVLVGAEKKEIKILFTGNDGYVSITGLNEGDTVVAP